MKYLLILAIPIILLISCDFSTEPIPYYTDTIAISDIDGSNLKSLCEHNGEIPYFIPNLTNPEGEELILLDSSSKIEVMNLDGTNRHTIIDTLGSVANFSDDRTKMLLNKNGEIYMANVDGSNLINLTNTPDIWEKDPAFSLDNAKIVYSYSTENNTHAFLIIKNIATNINEIVFDYKIRNNYRIISFNYPTYISDNKIIYEFYLRTLIDDQNLIRNELHQVDINNNEMEILIDYEKVYKLVYSNELNYSVLKIANKSILIDMTNLEQIYSFENTSYDTPMVFSTDGNFVSVGHVIYDIKSNLKYYVYTNYNSINQTNNKIVGVANRYYE